MIKFMFSVYDSKARAYGNPFTSPRQEMAVRDFTAAVRDTSTQLNKFPEDFTLVEIGEFDDETCSFMLHKNPIPLGLAAQFKE
ncbi:MAG: nonstructural protein [Microviridae sp.]|nr:MAG: nonstructural protein [Microviridae sp.]